MPMFRVTCADRSSGSAYAVDVEAATAGDATTEAARLGHLASRAQLLPADASPSSADTTTNELLRQVRDELMQTRLASQQIARSRVVRASIGTIATSVIVAMILWSILFGTAYMTLSLMAEEARRERMLGR